MKIFYSLVCLCSLGIGVGNLTWSNLSYTANVHSYIVIVASILLWTALVFFSEKWIDKPADTRTLIKLFLFVSILYAIWNVIIIVGNPTYWGNYVLLLSSLLGIYAGCRARKLNFTRATHHRISLHTRTTKKREKL